VSAAALVKLPDLALGTLLGSCIFNLTILALLDIIFRRGPLLNQASRRQIIPAGMGIVLIGIAALTIWGGDRLSGFSLWWVGAPSIIILIIYLVGARQMFRFERRHPLPSPQKTPPRYQQISTKAVCLRFIAVAVAVIAAGIWLSFIGDEIADVTGWGASFVGSLFLAITTSMPELVVCISSLRLGAIDMAVGDVLGANMLDMVVILWADIAYTKGPILAAVSKAHIATALVAIAMSLVIIVGLRFHPKRKTFFVFSWYTPVLIGLYILGAYLLFHSGVGIS
jgi:cation:H+ antiporter